MYIHMHIQEYRVYLSLNYLLLGFSILDVLLVFILVVWARRGYRKIMTRTWLQPYSMLMTMATIYMILLRRLCLLKKLTRTVWSGYCSPNMSGWVAARQWRPCLFSQFTLDYPHLQQTSNQTLLSRNMDFSAPNTALVVRQDEYPDI